MRDSKSAAPFPYEYIYQTSPTVNLTVDAYLEAEEFHAKCDFSPLVIAEPEDETVLMFFVLMGIA